MDKGNINEEVNRTLDLLKVFPANISDNEFNEKLWQRIDEHKVKAAFATLNVTNYRKAALAIIISLNILSGAILLYKTLDFSNVNTVEQSSLAQEYALVSNMYNYNLTNQNK
jgi:hypothetical protein